MLPQCSIPDCSKPTRVRGWCNMHYHRLRAHGDAEYVVGGGRRSDSPEKRFWARVQKTDSCWLWTGKLGPRGYATFSVGGKPVRVHRFAYELLVGPIPPGLTLDHLCRVRHCVSPAHLEAVPPGINVLRGAGLAAQNTRKTHCINGHPFSGANLGLSLSGERLCRACRREITRRYSIKKRSQLSAPISMEPSSKTR